MIQVKNIFKNFGENQVLNDINFTFHAGKTNLVIGASGSGKQTLIKCMVGLHQTDSGSILFNESSFNDLAKGKEKLRKKLECFSKEEHCLII